MGKGILGIRRVLYGAVRVLGDVNAISRGAAGKRIARRVAGKVVWKALRKIFIK